VREARNFRSHIFRAVTFVAVALSVLAMWPTVGAQAISKDNSKLPTEIASYAESLSGITAISNAEQILVSRCMARQGQIFYEELLRNDQISPLFSPPEPGSLAQRRKDGYGYYSVVIGEPTQGKASKEDSYIRGLSKAEQTNYERAMFGNPNDKVLTHLIDGSSVYTNSGGCFGIAYDEIFGSIENLVWSFNDLIPAINQISTLVSTKTPYAKALTAYGKCMVRRGYRVNSPEGARLYADNFYASHNINLATRAREVKVAVADYQCGASAHLNTSFETSIKSVWSVIPRHFKRELEIISTERGRAETISMSIVDGVTK